MADDDAKEASGLAEQNPPVYAKTGLALITDKMRR